MIRANWAKQGVELVDGDWNDSAAIVQALKGVEGAFVMLPAVWTPSPDYTSGPGSVVRIVNASLEGIVSKSADAHDTLGNRGLWVK